MMKSVLTLVSGREDRVLRRIRISEIVRNPNQPRRYFDPEAIATLAESIRQYGVLNPLTVRRTANGGYELVAGERRLRAARVAGLTDVPCLLINADGEDSSVIALVENLQRRDLDFFEEANGFKRLIEQFGLTQEEAKNHLLKNLENECKHDAALKIKEIETNLKDNADQLAREIISIAIQRLSLIHI